MKENKTASKETLSQLQDEIDQNISKYEQLRGFL